MVAFLFFFNYSTSNVPICYNGNVVGCSIGLLTTRLNYMSNIANKFF